MVLLDGVRQRADVGDAHPTSLLTLCSQEVSLPQTDVPEHVKISEALSAELSCSP
jgi:hypothetical protein